MLQDSPLYAYLPAKDVKRARAFYEGKLGFEDAGTNAASQAFWQVTDIEKEVADLKAKGVTFETYPGMDMPNGIATTGGTRAAWFKDTEGNILALIQGG